jgi:peptidoglycan hydrolase-like protein with peptidoglycan-binding domain
MACNIRPGERSENVKQLQRFLKNPGWYTGNIDGKYGKYTKMAVKTYNRKHGLDPDGYAGCKTTTKMKLACAKHNCNKTQPNKPTPPKPVTPPTPIVPPSSNPNRILPDHTVSIGNIGFYAEAPELVEPFQRTVYDKVEIENGPPRFYATNIRNREMNFKVTVIKKHPKANLWTLPYKYPNGKPNFQELLNDIKQCEGIKEFSSVYIGAFKALITIKITDFKPGTAIANFNVQEIP